MNIFSFLTHSYHFKEIDSTSSYLKRNYQRFKNMTFVSADYQSAGRGRNLRTWVSDKTANLLFSFIVKDESLVKQFDTLSILSAVCVKKVLDRMGINHVEIKWPNDVYINGKKVCGILLDGITNNNQLDSVVIGIGVNVNQTCFPDDLLIPPTSLALILKHQIDISKLKKAIYKQIKQDFKDIDKSYYLDIANSANFLKNKEVYMQINNEKRLVKVKDINKDNSLSIILDGEELRVKSGEVTFHI